MPIGMLPSSTPQHPTLRPTPCFVALRDIHAMIPPTVLLLVPSPTDPFLRSPSLKPIPHVLTS